MFRIQKWLKVQQWREHRKQRRTTYREFANTLRQRIETKLLSQGQDALLNMIVCGDQLLPESFSVSDKIINVDYFVIEEKNDYIILISIGGSFTSKYGFDILVPK